tara:strand:- start:5263 stop:5469 length:207 start_codon:yes stop_codon:yes gene_type:complete
MTQNEFRDWLSQPITKAFFAALDFKVEGLKEELAYQAGENPRLDGLKVGAIQALRDLKDVDWFEETQE